MLYYACNNKKDSDYDKRAFIEVRRQTASDMQLEAGAEIVAKRQGTVCKKYTES